MRIVGTTGNTLRELPRESREILCVQWPIKSRFVEAGSMGFHAHLTESQIRFVAGIQYASNVTLIMGVLNAGYDVSFDRTVAECTSRINQDLMITLQLDVAW